MEFEDKIVPACTGCIGKTNPGANPGCRFEKDVLTLIDNIQDGVVPLNDGTRRLSTLSQTANRKGCPNIRIVRRDLGPYINPLLCSRAVYNSGIVVSGNNLPRYDYTTRMAKSSRPPIK